MTFATKKQGSRLKNKVIIMLMFVTNHNKVNDIKPVCSINGSIVLVYSLKPAFHRRGHNTATGQLEKCLSLTHSIFKPVLPF